MMASLEAMLLRAEKLALKTLSPTARAVILALKALREGGKKVEELRETCRLYGFACKGLERALRYMEENGLLECGESICRLTEDGEQVAEALHEFARELREYVYSVVSGAATELDVFSYVATPLASAIGVIESASEAPDAIAVALIVHAYVSTLSAAVTAMLARIRPEVVEMLRKAYGAR